MSHPGATIRNVRGSAEERFLAKVDKTTECWLWTAAAQASGYGAFWDGERLVRAHRWAYEHWVGPIPDGLQLDHLCRTPACVNPAHLEPVTCHENVMRGETIYAAHAAKTHCPKGHPYDERNTYVSKRGERKCRRCHADHEYERYRRENPDRPPRQRRWRYG